MIPKNITASHKGRNNELDLHFKPIGNEQALALSQYIKVSNLEKVNLVGNKLLATGTSAILSSINN